MIGGGVLAESSGVRAKGDVSPTHLLWVSEDSARSRRARSRRCTVFAMFLGSPVEFSRSRADSGGVRAEMGCLIAPFLQASDDSAWSRRARSRGGVNDVVGLHTVSSCTESSLYCFALFM